MSILRSREFYIALVIVSSIFIYVPYFFEVPQFMSDVELWLTETTVVIIAFSVWVGLYTSTRRELVRVQRRGRGWFYGGILLGLAWAMVLSGLLLGKEATIYKFLQWAFVIPGDSTIYAILVFYLTSSGARAFRLRSLESTLLTFGAVFVLLKQAPLGELLAPWAGPVAIYLQDTLAMAATRVFNVSLAVGSVVLAVRLMAGQEMALIGLVRRAMGGDE